MTLEEFKHRAGIIHKNKYDYSLVKYENRDIKVKIICPKHGIFEQKPSHHLSGDSCKKCSQEFKRLTTDTFIQKATKIYGNKYDYSLINYIKSNIKVKIICPKHGIFEQTPNNHLRRMKCMQCAIEENGNNKRSTVQEFIKKAEKIHGKKFDYSQVKYIRNDIKVKIICRKHGAFFQVPASHLNKRGCPFCLESRGERHIALFLDSNKIKYKREKRFKKCRYKSYLNFDFYIPRLKTCIEYDGKQHFVLCEYFGGQKEFNRIQKSDTIKTNFCQTNGIKLIRIPYNKKDSEIISILKKEIIEPYYS